MKNMTIDRDCMQRHFAGMPTALRAASQRKLAGRALGEVGKKNMSAYIRLMLLAIAVFSRLSASELAMELQASIDRCDQSVKRCEKEQRELVMAWVRTSDLSPLPVPKYKDPRESESREIAIINNVNFNLELLMRAKNNKKPDERTGDFAVGVIKKMMQEHYWELLIQHRPSLVNASPLP